MQPSCATVATRSLFSTTRRLNSESSATSSRSGRSTGLLPTFTTRVQRMIVVCFGSPEATPCGNRASPSAALPMISVLSPQAGSAEAAAITAIDLRIVLRSKRSKVPPPVDKGGHRRPFRPACQPGSAAASASHQGVGSTVFMSSESAPQAFRPVPRTGVIFVTTEAQKRGFDPADPDWCNLGQGQPETGDLPGAPPRVQAVAVDPADQEYAPVAGLWELREAIAAHYNRTYRRGLPSKYSAENVCVSGGGRASLTRAAASLGLINLGHFLPDYTAYEELLDIFKAFTAIPILLDPERGYAFGPDALKKEINGLGLSAVLLSNPCNPTGKHIRGEELGRWVELSRELDCALLIDEFYSHYLWSDGAAALGSPLAVESAARYVTDVDRDPVVLFDGLTKNWRYPGWRVTWTVGPKRVIEAVASAGSFLDGGGSKPLQRAAIPLLEEAHVAAETNATQTAFRSKRDFLIAGLARLGI